MMISNLSLELFQSLFKGREDVYARRWENGDRDGYMPAYYVDWDRCEQHNIPSYLERSRSGNGGHVWIFFQLSYPAWKSRKIAFHIVRKAGILSEFEKDASFDRLFPNQDYHSGKGLGNLIALPLNKKWMADGNTCFIDSKTGEPFRDQWEFLADVQRVPASRLDKIYASIEDSSSSRYTSGSKSKEELEIMSLYPVDFFPI